MTSTSTGTSESEDTSFGKVVHYNLFAKHMEGLCFSDESSDVTFVVQDTHIRAHKTVLVARSDYFRALLYDGFKEKNQSIIELKDIPLNGFKILLKYIYAGSLTLSTLKEDDVLDVLELADRYGFIQLMDCITDYLKYNLKVANVCAINDRAKMLQVPTLMAACGHFFDSYANEIMAHETFLMLTPLALMEMIGRNTFGAREVDIFRSVCRWIERNPSDEFQIEILKKIRLDQIGINDLLHVVRPTGLFPSDAILDAINLPSLNDGT